MANVDVDIDKQNANIANLIATLADRLDPEAQARAQKKVFRPSNQSPPKISVKNPQGDKDYPRPKLKFTEVYVPYKCQPSDFSAEEIELLNLIEHGRYPVERTDGTEVEINFHVRTNDMSGAPERLTIIHPFAFNHENRQLMPGLAPMLRQVLGDKAKGVWTMKARERQVREGKLPVSQGE